MKYPQKMKSLLSAVSIVIFLYACQDKPNPTSTLTKPDTTNVTLTEIVPPAGEVNAVDTEDAIRWLTDVIENHLNEGGYPMEDICTPKYFEYKSDAMQVGYDGGMTEDEFSKKWSKDYDIKRSGMSSGFLISGQDNGKVKVTKCTLKSDRSKYHIIMNVTIEDTEMKATYHRDIKVVPVGKAYQIDDIVEFD